MNARSEQPTIDQANLDQTDLDETDLDQTAPDQTAPDQTAPDQTGTVVCQGCGRTADTLPLTWSYQTGPRDAAHPYYLCDRCIRDFLPAIEGKRDDLWW